MEIKVYLDQYIDSLNEIENLSKKIKKIEQQNSSYSVVQASSLYPPYQKKNIVIRHFDSGKKMLLDKYKIMLESRKRKLLENKLTVETFINTIPTSRLRLIFEYKYLQKLSWEKISLKIKNSTAESVRKEHDRYLKEIKSLSDLSDLNMLK